MTLIPTPFCFLPSNKQVIPEVHSTTPTRPLTSTSASRVLLGGYLLLPGAMLCGPLCAAPWHTQSAPPASNLFARHSVVCSFCSRDESLTSGSVNPPLPRRAFRCRESRRPPLRGRGPGDPLPGDPGSRGTRRNGLLATDVLEEVPPILNHTPFDNNSSPGMGKARRWLLWGRQ